MEVYGFARKVSQIQRRCVALRRKLSRFQDVKNLRFQGFKNSEFQDFKLIKISRLQDLKIFKLQRFQPSSDVISPPFSENAWTFEPGSLEAA